MTPGFTTHESNHGREHKRTLNTPMSPWEISETYSGLQMTKILMNIPKIKLMRIRFLRIALKGQHSLARVVLQNRQVIELLIPQKGGTWVILNETCCFWVNTSSWVKESLTVLKKNIQILEDFKEWSEDFPRWLQSLFGRSFSWEGIWNWLMPLTKICYHHIDAAYDCSMYYP